MQQRKQRNGFLSCPERQYLLAKVVAVLMVPVVVGSLWALMPEACAADNWNVDGANGVLHVRGALTESACRLEMTSAYQDVWLGKPAPPGWRRWARRHAGGGAVALAGLLACPGEQP